MKIVLNPKDLVPSRTITKSEVIEITDFKQYTYKTTHFCDECVYEDDKTIHFCDECIYKDETSSKIRNLDNDRNQL